MLRMFSRFEQTIQLVVALDAKHLTSDALWLRSLRFKIHEYWAKFDFCLDLHVISRSHTLTVFALGT